MEWLAFIATPIGGILAVVDHNSAGGLCTFLVLVALVLYVVPIAIREGFYRLPLTAAGVLFSIVVGAAVTVLIAFALFIALHSLLIFGACVMTLLFYGLVFRLLRDKAPA